MNNLPSTYKPSGPISLCAKLDTAARRDSTSSGEQRGTAARTQTTTARKSQKETNKKPKLEARAKITKERKQSRSDRKKSTSLQKCCGRGLDEAHSQAESSSKDNSAFETEVGEAVVEGETETGSEDSDLEIMVAMANEALGEEEQVDEEFIKTTQADIDYASYIVYYDSAAEVSEEE